MFNLYYTNRPALGAAFSTCSTRLASNKESFDVNSK